MLIMNRVDCPQIPSARRDRAMTLVELLVVVTIILVMISVSVPLMRNSIREGRTREASRQINAFLARAKAMAAETRRLAGVEFKRVAPGSNVVTEIYLVEMPPPYAGDVLGARAAVFYDTVQGRWEVDFLGADSVSLEIVNTTDFALVKPGEYFQIRFDYSGPLYQIYRDATNNNFVINLPNGIPPAGCWLPGADGQWGKKDVDDNNNGIVNDIGEAGWGYGAASPTDDVDTTNTPPTSPKGLTYQVYLSPRRTAASPLQLPPGTAVDLGYSGIGINFPATHPLSVSQDPYRVSGLEFAALVDPAPAVAPNPGLDAASVVVVFTPTGEVDHVQYGGSILPAGGAIHFLVGKFDQVAELQDNITTSPNPLRWSSTDTTQIPYYKNIVDTSSVWVSIGPQTGTLTSTENAWELYSNPAANPPEQPSLLWSMLRAREFAQSAQAMGTR